MPRSDAYANPTVGRRLCLQIPGMHQLPVRSNLLYTEPSGSQYGLDLYYPAGGAPRTPAVLIGGPPRFHAGKSSGQKVGWAQLLAASGLIAIAFDMRSDEILESPQEPCDDIVAAIDYVRANAEDLHVDAERMATLSFSYGTTPWHLWAVLRDPLPFIRCNVVFYGALDLAEAEQLSPEARETYGAVTYLRRHAGRIPPMLIAKAGEDQFAGINASIDRFASEAMRLNAPVEVIEHPDAPHGFDGRLHDERSRAIVRRAVDFFRRHLLAADGGPLLP